MVAQFTHNEKDVRSVLAGPTVAVSCRLLDKIVTLVRAGSTPACHPRSGSSNRLGRCPFKAETRDHNPHLILLPRSGSVTHPALTRKIEESCSSGGTKIELHVGFEPTRLSSLITSEV